MSPEGQVEGGKRSQERKGVEGPGGATVDSPYPVGNSEPLRILELGHAHTLGSSTCTGFMEVGDSRDAGRRREQRHLALGCQRGRCAEAGQMDAGGHTVGSAKWLA